MGYHLTPGRLLFEDAVPAEFRSKLAPDAALDNDTIANILQEVAEKAPDKYRDISHALLKLGARAAAETPSSFSLNDLKPPVDKQKVLAKLDTQEDAIFANKKLTPEQRNNALVKLYDQYSQGFSNQVYDAAMAQGSNLARMVASGARGNKAQLNSNIGADWLMIDANSNPIPIGIRNNYSEGLSPAEYFAAAYGTRRGLISTKFAVQDAGYLSKQLAAAAHDMVVTSHDCGTHRGIPTTPDDKDNVGAVLAKSVGGHSAGSIITARTLTDLKQKGVTDISVRSPLTCQAHGGLCASCAGLNARNRLSGIMDNVGLAASSSLGEPLAQGSLSEKHSGGVASSSGKAVSAFKSIDRLVQVPEVFPGGAAVARNDGKVSKIEPAPQGGTFVTVGGEQHYVDPDTAVKVKLGDELEAGDTLSEGVPNPADIVKHKGIGEGRLYFVKAMRDAFKNNGLAVNRRQLEVIGRALVNHVKVDDPEGMGHYLPDDIVEYNGIESSYQPNPESVVSMPAGKAVGQYLHRPQLHYSIGTRITPRVAKTLESAGEPDVLVGKEGPGFVPEMQRVAENPGFKEDWQAQMAGANIKKRLLSGVHSGTAESDLHGISYVPGLAYGLEFGQPPKGVVGY